MTSGGGMPRNLPGCSSLTVPLHHPASWEMWAGPRLATGTKDGHGLVNPMSHAAAISWGSSYPEEALPLPV